MARNITHKICEYTITYIKDGKTNTLIGYGAVDNEDSACVELVKNGIFNAVVKNIENRSNRYRMSIKNFVENAEIIQPKNK